MTFFAKICTALFISTLSLGAYAAEQPETPSPAPTTPSEQPQVDVGNPTEVIQVLYVGARAESKVANLILEKSSDEALRQFANELVQDATTTNQGLEKLAASKNVSLEADAMTQTAQAVQSRLTAELDAITAKPAEEFRAAVLSAVVAEHQRLIELYSRIEQQGTDDALKAAAAASRPLAEKHLATAQNLQLSSMELEGSESF